MTKTLNKATWIVMIFAKSEINLKLLDSRKAFNKYMKGKFSHVGDDPKVIFELFLNLNPRAMIMSSF